jgi:hypothetical protein
MFRKKILLFFYLLNYLPYVVRSLPYYLCFYIVKLRFIDLPMKVWFRNSLYFKNIIFLISDIDLTFYFKIRPSKLQLKKIKKRYEILKKFLPILGEINIYYKEDVVRFFDLANKYEIDRDPKLIERLDLKIKGRGDAEKIAFITRMFESDVKNIRDFFKLRRKKWNFHFGQIDLSTTIKLENTQSMYKNLKKLYSALGENYFEFINDILSKYEDNERYDQIYKDRAWVKYLMVLYPNRWIGRSFENGNIEKDLLLFKDFNEIEKIVFLEQIKWEVWGLMSQYMIMDKDQLMTLPEHMHNILEVLNNVKDKGLIASSDLDFRKQVEVSKDMFLEYRENYLKQSE